MIIVDYLYRIVETPNTNTTYHKKKMCLGWLRNVYGNTEKIQFQCPIIENEKQWIRKCPYFTRFTWYSCIHAEVQEIFIPRMPCHYLTKTEDIE